MENLTATPVVLSDNAIIELKRLMDEEGFNHEQVLRVGVKGGGCSGLSYVLAFGDAQPADEHFTI